MGMVQADELLKRWKVEELTVEQSIGQLLQHLVQLSEYHQQSTRRDQTVDEAIVAINTTLRNLRADVDGLIAHTNMPPPKTKRRAR